MKDRAEGAADAARSATHSAAKHPGEIGPDDVCADCGLAGFLDPVTCSIASKAARAAEARALERAAQEVRAIEAEVEDGETVVNLCDELERRVRVLASGNAPPTAPDSPSDAGQGKQEGLRNQGMAEAEIPGGVPGSEGVHQQRLLKPKGAGVVARPPDSFAPALAAPDAGAPTDGVVVSADGAHGLCVDKAHPNYGWILWKHPDGQWVTKRPALPDEIKSAEGGARLREILRGASAPAPPPVLSVDPAADARIEQLRASQAPEAVRPVLSVDLVGRVDHLIGLLLRAKDEFQHIPQRNPVHMERLAALRNDIVAACGPQSAALDRAQEGTAPCNPTQGTP